MPLILVILIISHSQISSTSLIAVFFTSVSSSYQYIRKGLTEKKIGVILAVSSIPGTFIGVYISNYFTLSEFRFYFALILIATSLYLLFRSRIIGQDKKIPNLSERAIHWEFSRIIDLSYFFIMRPEYCRVVLALEVVSFLFLV